MFKKIKFMSKKLVIPTLETQQKYPLFYAEATKTINDIIEHISKERGIYTSDVEPDPKEHNIWLNTNDNKFYRWVEEEQSWKTISGGSSEIVYFTEFKGDFYNGKTYIFDGNKYGIGISKVSPIEPITNFEAILINCDFISSNNGNHGIDIMFKYINGDTNTSKGIYYIKYIDGYCTITKLTDNIVIYGTNMQNFGVIDGDETDFVICDIIENDNYIEIVNNKDLNQVEELGITVSYASMLEIPQDITFFPFQSFEISKLILYGGIDLYHHDINKFEGTIDTFICYNGETELLVDTNYIYIDTLITDYPIMVNCNTVQTNNYSEPPTGDIYNMILCNTGNYYEIDNDYNIIQGYDFIPTYVLYGKFNAKISLREVQNFVFTEIPEYITFFDHTSGYPITLHIYCQSKHREQIEKLITDAKLAENINVEYSEIHIYSYNNTINITDVETLDIHIDKNYIK